MGKIRCMAFIVGYRKDLAVDVCVSVRIAVQVQVYEDEYGCTLAVMKALCVFVSNIEHKTLIRWLFSPFQLKTNSKLKSSASGRLSLRHIGVCADVFCVHMCFICVTDQSSFAILASCILTSFSSSHKAMLFTEKKETHLAKCVCMHPVFDG